ncbi:transposase IS4 family protein, partial [mine drainage metagenome]
GSYLSRIYPSEKDKKRQAHSIQVRVIEYRLEGVTDAEPIYRLVTSVLDLRQGPAHELAALYHERWE